MRTFINIKQKSKFRDFKSRNFDFNLLMNVSYIYAAYVADKFYPMK